MKRLTLSLLLLWLPLSARAEPEGGLEQLLAGARHFREGRFAAALVEFRVAEHHGAGGEATWYAAAALVKLGRAEEALETFERAQATAPEARDALLTYYQALACYEARLYLCADALLAEVGQGGGQHIAAQAARVRADIARMLASEPSRTAMEWYLARAAEAEAAGRGALARRYRTEAEGLAARNATPHRKAEARGAPPAAATGGSP